VRQAGSSLGTVARSARGVLAHAAVHPRQLVVVRTPAALRRSRRGYAAFKVADDVKSFSGYGMESYSFFNQGIDIFADHAFEVPTTLPSASLHDLLTVFPTRETSEASKGSYLDTTIHSNENSDALIRVDVTPNSSADAAASAGQMEQALSSQPGYREIRFTPTTFHGYSGVAWEFVVSEHGVLLHKVDVVLDDGYGDGVAVLTQAPADEYQRWQPIFAHMRQSLLIA
jgi:hypothetical protein